MENRKRVSWVEYAMMQKQQSNTSHKDAKTAENYGAHFEWAPAKGSHTYHKTVKMESASQRVLELQQKTRKIIKGLCLLSLFSRGFNSSSLSKAVNSFFILCLSLLDDY